MAREAVGAVTADVTGEPSVQVGKTSCSMAFPVVAHLIKRGEAFERERRREKHTFCP